MFITALQRPKYGNKLKCLSMSEWITKMWYMDTKEYYPAMRKKEILPFLITWIDPEGTMLSEVRQ